MARVAFEVDSNDANRDIEAVEHRYVGATKEMSDSALKLELAQERLRRALAKGPAAAREQARALLSVRAAEREVERETQAAAVATERQSRSLQRGERQARGYASGLRSIRSGAAVAVAGLVGGSGLAYALRSVFDAAKEQELVLGQTKVVLNELGLDYEKNADRIQRSIRRQSSLGFDDEALERTFQMFVRNTRDVDEALRRNDIAVNVSRARYISLEQAAQLVNKASLGQAGALRRLGIDVDKHATRLELLAALETKFAGAAEGASNTATGATDRFDVALENLKETIGTGLLPVVTPLINRFAAWVDRASQSEEFQRKLNDTVGDAVDVAQGFAGALGQVRDVAAPVVDALGGIERVTRLLVGLFVARKLLSFADGLATIGRRAGVAAIGVNTLATAEEREALARSRGSVAGVPAGRGGRTTIPGTTGTRGAGLVPIAGAIALTVIGTEAMKPPSLKQQQLRVAETTAVDRAAGMRLAHKFSSDYGTALNDLVTSRNPFFQVRGIDPLDGPRRAPLAGAFGTIDLNPGGKRTPQSPGGPAFGSPGFGAATTRPQRGAGGRGGDGLSRLQRLGLASAEADLSPGLSDDLRAARDEVAYYAKVVANSKLRGDKLYQARQDLLSAKQREQSIRDQMAADRQREIDEQRRQEEQQEARAKQARERLAAARKRQVDAVRRSGVTAGPYATLHEGFDKAGMSAVDLLREKPGKPGSEAATLAQIQAATSAALSQMIQIQQRFAPNFQVNTAALETHGYNQNAELRRQTEVLERLSARTAFPASGYTVASAEAVSS